jgi:hypothetical protein
MMEVVEFDVGGVQEEDEEEVEMEVGDERNNGVSGVELDGGVSAERRDGTITASTED